MYDLFTGKDEKKRKARKENLKLRRPRITQYTFLN